MMSTRLLAIGTAFLMLLPAYRAGAEGVSTTPPAGEVPSGRPAHLQRGDEVETRYRVFRTRLERDFETLGASLRHEAPHLYRRLKDATPDPIPHGYQIIPRLVADLAPSSEPTRASSAAFSWRRTEAILDVSLRRLGDLGQRLAAVMGVSPDARQGEWPQLVEGYVALARRHRLINKQIRYNWTWQNDIARRRPRYDYMTLLHDAVLERQALLDAMDADDLSLDPSILQREQSLLQQIRRHTDVLNVPDFVSIEQPHPRQWIVRVRVYTDIQDPSFVQAFIRAVETAWQVKEGEDDFQVSLDVRTVSPERLHADRAPPARGDHIDLVMHSARFPRDGAVLTTGASTLHVRGRSINLAPYDVAPNVLAHEFGHILGFVDGYLRGYRDVGPEGYEVLEVTLDPGDIMGEPTTGRVHRRHFERLLAARTYSPH